MAARENNLNYGAYCGLYCGACVTRYDEECDGCGAELYDCRAEERDLPA